MKPFLPVLTAPLGRPNLYVPAFTAGAGDDLFADVEIVPPNSRPVLSSTSLLAEAGATAGNNRPVVSDANDYLTSN